MEGEDEREIGAEQGGDLRTRLTDFNERFLDAEDDQRAREEGERALKVVLTSKRMGIC